MSVLIAFICCDITFISIYLDLYKGLCIILFVIYPLYNFCDLLVREYSDTQKDFKAPIINKIFSKLYNLK